MPVRLLRTGVIALSCCALVACAQPGRDTGPDSHDLATMKASVWVDPDGCKHWVIDDGLEGYMSPVLTADGKPDCG